MKNKTLFALWGGLFILCAGLGFIPEPEGVVRDLLTAVSVVFFAPPALLIHKGRREEVKLVRNFSALSLGMTVLLLVINFLCAMKGELLGTVLHFILVVVSAPMIACGSWALSLFLWACLLFAAVKKQ